MASPNPRTRSRPHGWGPAMVLAWLAENPTAVLHTWLAGLAKAEGDNGATEHLLNADISRWKAKVPDFRHQYIELMKARGGGVTGAGRPPRELTEEGADWFEVLLEHYRVNGKKIDACAAAGVSFGHFGKLIQPGSDRFRQDLYDRFMEVHRERLVVHEDRLEDAYKVAAGQDDAKTMANIAFGVLERRDRAGWSRGEVLRHEGTVHHLHTIQERNQKALEQAGDISRKLFGPVPERQEVVIDAEFRELEKVPAAAPAAAPAERQACVTK